jgi:DNA-binding MarR family transcriptional regulator
MKASRRNLIGAVGAKIPPLQNATQDVDQAAAKALGVNLTDLRCVGLLSKREQISASALAESLGLTRGAVTALLDRLAKARLAIRSDDPNDRRGILVSATPHARKRIQALWGPIQEDGEKLLSAYSDESLELIGGFLDQVRALQVKHAKRISAEIKA